MGGSSSKSSSKPVDMTPEAFKNLQGPFAQVIGNLVGQYIPSGTEAIMKGYQGPTTSPIGSNEQTLLNNLMQTTNSQQGQQPIGPGSPLPGVPAMAENQVNLNQSYLNQLTGQATQAPQQGQGISQQNQELLNSTALSGSSAGNAAQFAQGLGIGNVGGPQGNLSQFGQELAGASQTGAFGGENPFMQQYIQAAQRQTQQALEETLGRTLPGRFAQAGHITQPGGSSAFDRAAAIAYRGGADALGDIATNISYQGMEAARGREADALGAELGRRGQFGLQTQALTANAQQQQLDRALQAPGMAAQIENLGANTNRTLAEIPGLAAQTALTLGQARGQEAGVGLTQAQTGLTNAQTQGQQANTGLTQAQTQTQQAQTGLVQGQASGQEINNLVTNLQAQALPRLIQEMGVERGTEAFNNRVNALLSSLGIAAGVTRPVIGNSSSSSSSSMQLK